MLICTEQKIHKKSDSKTARRSAKNLAKLNGFKRWLPDSRRSENHVRNRKEWKKGNVNLANFFAPAKN